MLGRLQQILCVYWIWPRYNQYRVQRVITANMNDCCRTIVPIFIVCEKARARTVYLPINEYSYIHICICICLVWCKRRLSIFAHSPFGYLLCVVCDLFLCVPYYYYSLLIEWSIVTSENKSSVFHSFRIVQIWKCVWNRDTDIRTVHSSITHIVESFHSNFTLSSSSFPSSSFPLPSYSASMWLIRKDFAKIPWANIKTSIISIVCLHPMYIYDGRGHSTIFGTHATKRKICQNKKSQKTNNVEDQHDNDDDDDGRCAGLKWMHFVLLYRQSQPIKIFDCFCQLHTFMLSHLLDR